MQRAGGRPDGSDMKGGARGKFDPWKAKAGKAKYVSDEIKSVSRKNDESRKTTASRSVREQKKGPFGGFFGR